MLNVIQDNRTLAEIYSDIPSPTISSCGPIAGLRSRLYTYQRRSVSAMVYREASSTPIPDPLFIPVTGINGKTFYLQPGQMEIVNEQPRVASNCGGILCEELGQTGIQSIVKFCAEPFL